MFSKSTIFLFIAVQAVMAQSSHHPVRPGKTSDKPECPLIRGPLTHDLTQPCYVLDGFVAVKGDVKIAAGTKLIFRQNALLDVPENTSLSAIGTQEHPILMEGRNHLPGSWSGVEFSSVSPNNRLSYVQVSDAGSDNGTTSGAVRLTRSGVAAIDHSVIRNAKTYGLYVPENTRLLSFTDNRFEQNEDPMNIHTDALASIDGKTEFVGNRKQRIRVTTGGAEKDAEWPAFSVPIYFDNFTGVGANIRIAPGTQLLFAQNACLCIKQNGSLNAQGSAAKPIVFSSPNQIAGAWHGIGIASISPNNVLEHVEVLWAGGGGAAAAVHVGYGGPGTLRLVNSVIRDSDSAGVMVEPGSSDTSPKPEQLAQSNQIVGSKGQAVVHPR